MVLVQGNALVVGLVHAKAVESGKSSSLAWPTGETQAKH